MTDQKSPKELKKLFKALRALLASVNIMSKGKDEILLEHHNHNPSTMRELYKNHFLTDGTFLLTEIRDDDLADMLRVMRSYFHQEKLPPEVSQNFDDRLYKIFHRLYQVWVDKGYKEPLGYGTRAYLGLIPYD